jgi:hypothetical protein
MSDLDFHSSYRLFAEALEMLAGEPEEPCKAMGDFNVAWECCRSRVTGFE